MIYFKAFFLCTLCLILQSTLLQWSLLSQFHPDLVVLAVVVIALRYGPILGVFCGFYSGLLQDVYAIETLGAGAFAKSVLGYLIGLVNEKKFSLTPLTKIFLLVVAIIGHDILSFIVMGLNSQTIMSALYQKTFPAIILTGFFAIPVFYFSKYSRTE